MGRIGRTQDAEVDRANRRKVTANLFPYARPAVEPWAAFPWHLDREGVCDSWQPHSSQALAIDVFGSVQQLPQEERDAAMNAVARSLGLGEDKSWRVELEWVDPKNRLREKRRTQVDAIARSAKHLVLFESKFTEHDGGGCSQPLRLRKGARSGLTQCTGSHKMQRNRASGTEDRCALSGKGIRYWEIIPEVFRCDSQVDHVPCPFAGPWFQWMRNLTLCWTIAQDEGLSPAFVIAYADAAGLPFVERLKSAAWSDFERFLRPRAIVFSPASYQSLLGVVQETGASAAVWADLARWVEGKILTVTRQRTATRRERVPRSEV